MIWGELRPLRSLPSVNTRFLSSPVADASGQVTLADFGAPWTLSWGPAGLVCTLEPGEGQLTGEAAVRRESAASRGWKRPPRPQCLTGLWVTGGVGQDLVYKAFCSEILF